MRRSRKDINLGRVIQVGQTWRCRTSGELWTVAQVHRFDCDAVMHQGGYQTRRITVLFEDLRKDWDRLVPAEVAA